MLDHAPLEEGQGSIVGCFDAEGDRSVEVITVSGDCSGMIVSATSMSSLLDGIDALLLSSIRYVCGIGVSNLPVAFPAAVLFFMSISQITSPTRRRFEWSEPHASRGIERAARLGR